jgi:hypothetical protein
MFEPLFESKWLQMVAIGLQMVAIGLQSAIPDPMRGTARREKPLGLLVFRAFSAVEVMGFEPTAPTLRT